MKTKIVLFIGIAVLFIFGNALAEIFLQVNTTGGVYIPNKDSNVVLNEVSEQ